MIGFCRWVAEYYQAPLGEVLRAALPQGEQASATRAVRLTAAGRQALERQPALIPDASRVDPVLAALAAAGGELGLRRLERGRARAPPGSCPGWSTAGLVEVGDEVQNRRPPPTVAYARATGASADTLPKRAAAKRLLAGKLAAAGDGLLVSSLSAAERTTLRALVAAGIARVEHRPVERAPEARAALVPAGMTLMPAQAHAVDTLNAALAGGFASFLLHGVTGSGKTEVYLRVIAEARAAGRGALVLVPGDRADAAAGGALPRRASARTSRCCTARCRRASGWRPGAACGRARSASRWARARRCSRRCARSGVVVVDEEHDPSFKQEEGVRYHGRDLAVVRARSARARWRSSARRRRRWRAPHNVIAAGASRAWCCPSARRRGRCPR